MKRLTAAIVLAIVALVLAAPAVTAPRPSAISTRWQLAIYYAAPQPIQVKQIGRAHV